MRIRSDLSLPVLSPWLTERMTPRLTVVDVSAQLDAVCARSPLEFPAIHDLIRNEMPSVDGLGRRLIAMFEVSYSSVGYLNRIYVHRHHRAMGEGARMMARFQEEVESHTDVDFLFAKVMTPQSKGFDLKSFYERRGYQGVTVANTFLLMANKGQAARIRNWLLENS